MFICKVNDLICALTSRKAQLHLRMLHQHRNRFVGHIREDLSASMGEVDAIRSGTSLSTTLLMRIAVYDRIFPIQTNMFAGYLQIMDLLIIVKPRCQVHSVMVYWEHFSLIRSIRQLIGLQYSEGSTVRTLTYLDQFNKPQAPLTMGQTPSLSRLRSTFYSTMC